MYTLLSSHKEHTASYSFNLVQQIYNIFVSWFNDTIPISNIRLYMYAETGR